MTRTSFARICGANTPTAGRPTDVGRLVQTCKFRVNSSHNLGSKLRGRHRMSGSATRRAGGTFDAKKYLPRVVHAYSALTPPRFLKIPSIFSFSDVHDFFLIDILLDDHLNKYPPARDYQRSFWKWALEKLESLSGDEEDNEIDERMYQHYTTLISSVWYEPNTLS